MYSDRRQQESKNINGVENKATSAPPLNTSAGKTDHSVSASEPVTIKITQKYQQQEEEEFDQNLPTKSTYHSFFVYPRSKPTFENSPNLLWHELKVPAKGQRGRSLSPSLSQKFEKISQGSLPNSARLVKKSLENVKPNYKINANPLISRDRVDKALETLRSRSCSPQVPIRSSSRMTRFENFSKSSPKSAPKEAIASNMAESNENKENQEEPKVKKVQIKEDKLTESETVVKEGKEETETPQFKFSVVVAVDFGTTFSGYAYSFTHDPENIQIMRKWEGK